MFMKVRMCGIDPFILSASALLTQIFKQGKNMYSSEELAMMCCIAEYCSEEISRMTCKMCPQCKNGEMPQNQEGHHCLSFDWEYTCDFYYCEAMEDVLENPDKILNIFHYCCVLIEKAEKASSGERILHNITTKSEHMSMVEQIVRKEYIPLYENDVQEICGAAMEAITMSSHEMYWKTVSTV